MAHSKKKAKKQGLFVIVLKQLLRFWLFVIKLVFWGKFTTVMLKVSALLVVMAIMANYAGSPSTAGSLLALTALPIAAFGLAIMVKGAFR